MEKATLCQRLRDEGLSNKQIAKKVGKNERTLQLYLSILNAPNEVQEALHKGEISLYVAIELAKEGGEYVFAPSILKEIIKKGLSVREVKGLVASQAEAQESGDGAEGEKRQTPRGSFVPVRFSEKPKGGFKEKPLQH